MIIVVSARYVLCFVIFLMNFVEEKLMLHQVCKLDAYAVHADDVERYYDLEKSDL